ncbi:protein-tyrosine-phosphatase [Roseibium aquae]|uniref:protein-tyrosine-phosphatase n=1 Tax=Roseibium aquae TaxID=1323746 RepID=A0A916WWY7_9HYPH|nr:low molecular weight protein-tyrosine-phosphatase [Roseibium aquae]GGB38952.1 protein-tyrosine-phosphatase [Roseibium aquae]
MPSVLFVCLGNICRSPLAEGLFRHAVETAGLAACFEIASAGTGDWHIGDPPDPRSVDIARKYGLDIGGQRARQVQTEDFHRFDLICAMDRTNLTTLQDRAPVSATAELRLFLRDPLQDVPDPYFGGPDGFEHVYRMVAAGAFKLLDGLHPFRT